MREQSLHTLWFFFKNKKKQTLPVGECSFYTNEAELLTRPAGLYRVDRVEDGVPWEEPAKNGKAAKQGTLIHVRMTTLETPVVSDALQALDRDVRELVVRAQRRLTEEAARAREKFVYELAVEFEVPELPLGRIYFYQNHRITPRPHNLLKFLLPAQFDYKKCRMHQNP